MNFKPRYTEIIQKIELDNMTIIRENYYGYPNSESNLYAKDNNGIVIWFAELPMINDCYSNEMRLVNDSITTGTWNGFTIILNAVNGKIIEQRFTK
jgi:hypothetical protein